MSHTTYVHHDVAQEGGEKRREGGGTRVRLTQALMQGHTKMGDKAEGGETIPGAADYHQRASETSDQMACFLKCGWMIWGMGGSIISGRGTDVSDGSRGRGGGEGGG